MYTQETRKIMFVRINDVRYVSVEKILSFELRKNEEYAWWNVKLDTGHEYHSYTFKGENLAEEWLRKLFETP